MISDRILHHITEDLSRVNGDRAVCVIPCPDGTHRATVWGGRQYLIDPDGNVSETVPDHSRHEWDPIAAEEARELAREMLDRLTPVQMDALVLGFPYPLPYAPQLHVGDAERLADAILAYEDPEEALERVRFYEENR